MKRTIEISNNGTNVAVKADGKTQRYQTIGEAQVAINQLLSSGYSLFAASPREAAKDMARFGIAAPAPLALFGMDAFEKWESSNYTARPVGSADGHWQAAEMVSIDAGYRQRNQLKGVAGY